MSARLLILAVPMFSAWELSSLKTGSVGSVHTAKLGLSNLDLDEDLFGAGAGVLLEAEVYEDWVTTDSRRLQASFAGSGIVFPTEPEEVITAEPTQAAPPQAAPTQAAPPSAVVAPTATSPTGEPAMKPGLGGSQDEGGCYTAAGFSYCAAKGKCLRPWEEPCEVEEVEEPAFGKGSGAALGGAAFGKGSGAAFGMGSGAAFGMGSGAAFAEGNGEATTLVDEPVAPPADVGVPVDFPDDGSGEFWTGSGQFGASGVDPIFEGSGDWEEGDER